jgi:hypothetical protein
MSFQKAFADMAKCRMIGHTSYFVEIVSKKRTRAKTREDSRRFNQRIANSIHAAIFKAVQAVINENIKAGKLSKRFGVTVQ